MFKKIVFWLFSVVGAFANASNIIEVTQEDILNLNNSSFLLVDVRSPKEFLEGHVPNALNIPLDQLSENPNILNSAEGKTIVLYCRSGFRAQKAAKILKENGHTNLHHLKGDMLAWVKSGLPIEK